MKSGLETHKQLIYGTRYYVSSYVATIDNDAVVMVREPPALLYKPSSRQVSQVKCV